NEAMYGVNVTAVNTMKYIGKLKTRNTKAGAVSGRAATYKKAIITLKDGETIDFYSNI
ncbi:50S ribosomal protein L23, partial [Mucilaginibacter sp. 5B2]|nr:50S ribosomal protein L23 [Mucilaginibacter sp. 5B2]